MMKRVLTMLVAVSIGAAFAGCSSPAADTAFQPPQGWKSTPGVFGRFQMWMNGSDAGTRQILMLVRGDKSMSMAEMNASSPIGAKGMQNVKRDTITLCGSQRAEHFTGRGKGKSGSKQVDEAIEGVTTVIGDAKYAVLYIRPVAMKADTQAEAALHSICPKAS